MRTAGGNGAREKVAWILVRQGRVLVTRNEGRDLFYMPGGMREPGESDAQTLVREIREELTATIDAATMAHVVTVEMPRGAGDPEFRMICYTAGHHGDLTPSHEVAEMAWLGYPGRARVSPADQLVFDALRSDGQIA